MATQEERLSRLEKEVSELKQELARRHPLEGLRTDVQELRARYQAHEEYVTERLNTFESHVMTQLEEHKGAIENLANQIQGLAAGQRQILELLTGKIQRND